MPFTFSHPALVLPLRFLPKGWVSLTGLVAGSLVPDFEKFIKMEPGNTYSHTWAGVFWFNLPLGLLLAFVFHGIVRDPLIDNLPVFLRKRLARFRKFNWQRFFREHFMVVILSIIAGALSHLTWDSFTHREGKFVRLLPVLSETVSPWNIHVSLYVLVDRLSSALGFLLILYVILKLPPGRVEERQPVHVWHYWLSVVLVALCVVMFRVIADVSYVQYFELLITSISAVLAGLVVSSCIVKFRT
ncbi:DUF4184 family protein [Pontibacter sp. 172403-2]|uniref:DUF4184 family protein n=1 Tax=Pontibacter rufus TaxID=2791028 RepID=UPI0018AFE00A|nr:DUF4184 family protein [Pontibacter sp. 172403-2]MBF9253266.1 DUF4184 family protein [Pontibacter sp. 172403-2]